ncbi:MAG TPA: Gfo/Idh/MocA family oxidoreductase [Trueperaceae bacterium]
MPKRLRVALIGAGRIGAGHARRLASIPDCQLVTVVDNDMERARQVAQPLGAGFSTDYREVLADRDVDAVAIATQVGSHVELAVAAAQTGKPFFVEKPLAHDLEAGWRVVEAVERTGTPAMVGFHRRFDPPYVEARKRLRSGELGRLEGYRAVARDPYPPALEYLITSGDLLVDMGIHDLDCARFLVGEVAEVSAIGSALAVPELAPHGLFDTAVATLRFENGAVGTLEVALRTAYGYEIRTEVLGERGRLHLEIDRQPDLLVYDERGGGFDRPRSFEERFGPAYQRELEAFVSNVLEDVPLDPAPREAWLSLRLALAAQHSLKGGETVRVEEFAPLPSGGATSPGSTSGANLN